MIKRLFFMGALLVPGLACGADPSAPLSVEVVTAGPAPAVPAPAAAAGFTTLAANYDFTTSFYATQSNWLGCDPNSSATKQWYLGQWFFTKFPPCNINQVFDAAAGSDVIRFTWLPEYFATTQPNNHGMYISMLSHDNDRVTDYPYSYIEFTARITPAVDKSYFALWTYSQVGAQDGNGANEYDIVEIFGICDFCAKAGVFQWDAGGTVTETFSGLPGGFDTTVYHKYAMRIKRTGNTIEMCSYIDDILQGSCRNLPNPTTRQLNQRSILIIGNGTCCGEGESNNTAVRTDLFVKNIRMWSCATWQTTTCSGTALTGAP
jgi:hypothetical protein